MRDAIKGKPAKGAVASAAADKLAWRVARDVIAACKWHVMQAGPDR